ncbi:MAG: DNA polymerase III subunit delta [Sphingomonadaceae bacterium]|nr:DNA polymerase III subunit delta [Sphingomonadaceae bacterium]
MKANEAQVARALDAPGATRLFLLHGPDDAGSRALAARLERAMGPDVERIDLDGAALKEDPARLPDEAAAISLFGTKRHIRVAGGDECADAIAALLDAGVDGDPVVMIAGVLKPSSALLKRVLADPRALAFASYRPEGGKAEDLALSLARQQGLRLAPRVAAALADACAGNRAVLERELEKLALFLDAAPDRPREATIDALEAIGADLGEVDTSRLVDAAFDGDVSGAASEFAGLTATGTSAIPLVRGLARRALLLARMRAEVERGKPPGAVMAASGKSLFFKEKDAVGRQLGRWNAARLATVATRLFDVEQAIKRSRSAGDVLVGAEIVSIARVGASLR